MQAQQRTILAGLLALLALAAVGLILTSNHGNPIPLKNSAPSAQTTFVDQSPLQTAQKLARLAVTPEEQEFAQEALRLGDREVDQAFTSALRNVTLHPPKLSPEARELSTRVKQVEADVKALQDEVTRLTALVAKAPDDKKENLQQQLELAAAQLDLEKDELDDARQDLIRAGGDPQSAIEHERDEHEASMAHSGSGGAPGSAPSGATATYETTTSRSAIAQFRGWSELDAKQKQLRQAQQDALERVAALSKNHKALEEEVKQEKPEKTALAQKAKASFESGAATTGGGRSEAAAAALAAVQHLNENQKSLAEFDKRIQDEQGLADVYAKWIAYVKSRQRAFLHGLILCAVGILVIAVIVIVSESALERFFARLAPERRRLHTMYSVIRFSTRVAGLAVVLLVIFGPPNQLATVLALAGAGLTVALKDFIVGFFGWFVLMGRNGISPGDWVEINGVSGEVIEVGLMYTVLLETGSWSDAGHPTGRKVTFVNSYAIEGHYFNFSTAGQWLWDELQVQVDPGTDPYPVAEAIQKMVADETEPAAREAEKEWQHVTPTYNLRPFSAAPSMSVRPTGGGVLVTVRYLTRAQERHEVRARLYRAVVELLHRKKVPQAPRNRKAEQPAADRR
jgi:small-conductance mechanosensitive channel